MSKKIEDSESMRPEYDFTRGVRGKYADRYKAGSNVVVIEDDLAQSFPSAETVNAALRRLLEVERSSAGHP
jgi:hypothetical protein